MFRVFLDANVLFSAAYLPDAGLTRLWAVPDTEVVTSAYAVEEARRNLESEQARARLAALLERTEVVSEALNLSLSGSISLRDQDRPILQAAIAADATHLITGDLRDFGSLLGRKVEGVRIETPSMFLRRV